MVYKRYVSPFEDKHPKPQQPLPPPVLPPSQKPKHSSFTDKFSSDDILLAALIIILLAEDKENRDIPLVLTLVFLFLIQYIEQ